MDVLQLYPVYYPEILVAHAWESFAIAPFSLSSSLHLAFLLLIFLLSSPFPPNHQFLNSKCYSSTPIQASKERQMPQFQGQAGNSRAFLTSELLSQWSVMSPSSRPQKPEPDLSHCFLIVFLSQKKKLIVV